ncbi:uncharacterized protein LOC105437924 [Strongylocentrotus purpuratus]|uniref:Uncharacterized protein n=1 Tax=Strongylocentrotus purpuratus TaxID=7668 RepID=A0A7M7LSN2_STRPU|nr:uncharacterized protein LOC105437924 [Strongylocentrotus purpuratus]|eukprot:XP_011663400.1 PREDICTED: uncharacterized protein LOC105437924 [Strongylocentrotus purpuratus]
MSDVFIVADIKDQPAILGRNWLESIQPNWRSVFKVAPVKDDPFQGSTQHGLSEIQRKHQAVFEPGLGTMTNHKAKIKVKSDAQPCFNKARPVSYALRNKVEAELDKLVEQGVLIPVSHSNWAAPIVVVPKSDKSIRICGDYKTTINPVLDVVKYPLPNPQDLFSTLAGGCCFTKLDLSQVETLNLDYVKCPTPASSHHLVEALCSMPNLTDLTLGMYLNDEFYSLLKANASSIQVKTLKLHAVTPASSQLLAEALCYMPNLSDLTLETDLNEEPEEFLSSLKTHASSIQGCFPQIRKGNFRFNGIAQDGLNSFLHTLSRRRIRSSDYPQHQHMGGVHSPRRTIRSSDHPQHQHMGGVHSSRRTIRSSDHPQHQHMGGVHSSRRTIRSSYHPQHQHMGGVHSSRRTIHSSDHPQHQHMGGVHSPRRTIPPSDHPQQQPMGDVHSSRRTLPPSDHPQQHDGFTSDAVCQFSQTHREGSSSQSKPYKRQAPSTQSRVPQDDPEIPEKQSKYDI